MDFSSATSGYILLGVVAVAAVLFWPVCAECRSCHWQGSDDDIVRRGVSTITDHYCPKCRAQDEDFTVRVWRVLLRLVWKPKWMSRAV